MVTTGVVEIAAVTGAAPGQSAQAGGDNSLFAQLLCGVVSDVTTASIPAAPAKSGSKPNVTIPDAAAAPDVLALCGLPVATIATTPVAPATTSIPTSEVVTKSSEQSDAATLPDAALQALAGSESAVRMAAPQASEPGPEVASQTSNENALLANDSRSVRAADLRWLNSGVGDAQAEVATTPNVDTEAATQLDAQVAQLTAQPEQRATHTNEKSETQAAAQAGPSAKHNAAEQIATAVQYAQRVDRDVADSALKPDNVTGAEQQPAFQKLMSQVTPLMNMIAGQSRDTGADQSRDTTITDAPNPLSAAHAAGLQPAGTQLARDMPVLDMTPRHHLHAAVGSQQWATELGDKLTMMAVRDTQSATLYMTPADMGPVQVRIEMNQDQASVWFTAENPETRSALEQSLPKLREMFNAQGMSLTDAGVFGDRSRQQQPDGNFTPSRFAGFQYEDSETLADTAAVRTISLGLLDAYA